MGNKVVQFDENKSTLLVDDVKYKFTPGIVALIGLKHPLPIQWNPSDYKAYNEIVAQTKVKSFPNKAGTARTTCYTEMEAYA